MGRNKTDKTDESTIIIRPTTDSNSVEPPEAHPVSEVRTPVSHRKLIGIVLVVGVIVIAISANVLTSRNKISAKDVTDAESATNLIASDLSAASTALSNLENAGSSSDIANDAKTVNDNLSKAQTQYKLLQQSRVLRNQVVNQQFEAVNKKWQPYLTFMTDDANDLRTLTPTLNTFEGQAQLLAATSPTTSANLASYLTSFKTLVDSTNKKVAAIKPASKDNQQLVQAFTTFLQAAASSISAAQNDLNTGKDIYTAEADLFKITASQTTFQTAINKINSDDNIQQQQLDPTAQFNSFLDALNKLSAKNQ